MKAGQKTQAGFTLIELVVVIVILGILAATALPKFMDLSKDARGGVIKGLEGSMRAADTMLYAKAAAAGLATTAPGATNLVAVNGVNVSLAYGYAADATELAKTLTLSPSADFDITDVAQISHKQAADYTTTPSNCSVAFTAATSATVPAKYVSTISGC